MFCEDWQTLSGYKTFAAMSGKWPSNEENPTPQSAKLMTGENSATHQALMKNALWLMNLNEC